MIITVLGIVFIICAVVKTARMMEEAYPIGEVLWPMYAAGWCLASLLILEKI